MHRGALVAAVVVTLSTAVVSAQNYTGLWELQAIGQDGTEIKVEHEGDRIVLYRVMWPVFEGEKYKLEHLYRGKIIGSAVTGNLLVRDDPGMDFEVLRSFSGRIDAEGSMVVDDLPLKLRKAGGVDTPSKPNAPPPTAGKGGAELSETSGGAKKKSACG